jgi:hypothetical protein
LLVVLQAFYEAGTAWRELGETHKIPGQTSVANAQLSMAFVFLNRFLDLCDAIDEPDASAAVS